MNTFKTALILIVLLTLSSTLALANNVSLPDTLQTQILEFEAAGNFAMADSLTRSGLAQAKLDARQAKAQAELDARQAAAQHKLEKQWASDVHDMDYSGVWTWCDSTDKATFLGSRYNINLEGLTNLDIMVSTLKNAVSDRLTIRREVDKKTAGMSSAIAILVKKVNQNEKGIADNKLTISEHDLKILNLIKLAQKPANEEASKEDESVKTDEATETDKSVEETTPSNE